MISHYFCMQTTTKRLHFLITFCTLLLTSLSNAQDSNAFYYTNINKVTVVKAISGRVSSTYTSLHTDIEKEYPNLNFTPGIRHRGTVPNQFVTKKILLKFNIRNSTDTLNSIYFFPGFYYTKIQLYKVEGSTLSKIPNMLPNNPDSIGYRLISLNAHDSATIIAELVFFENLYQLNQTKACKYKSS